MFGLGDAISACHHGHIGVIESIPWIDHELQKRMDPIALSFWRYQGQTEVPCIGPFGMWSGCDKSWWGAKSFPSISFRVKPKVFQLVVLPNPNHDSEVWTAHSWTLWWVTRTVHYCHLFIRHVFWLLPSETDTLKRLDFLVSNQDYALFIIATVFMYSPCLWASGFWHESTKAQWAVREIDSSMNRCIN